MQNTSFLGRLSKGLTRKAGSLFHNPYRKVNIGWFGEKYYKHLPPGKIRSHKLFGKECYFVNPQEFMHGLKELFLEELYRQKLGPRPYILDCGANIGLSIIYLKQLFPDAEIVAFEPDTRNFSLLARNIESFGYRDVTLRQEAVWKENATLRFSNDGSMSSKITDQDVAGAAEVKAVRLRDFLNRPVDFLKIDIEGAEFHVITDVADRLDQVKDLFLEYHGVFGQQQELTAIFSLLTEKGFRYYIKEATSVYDHPFVPRKDPVIPFDIQLNIFCFRGPA